MIKNICNKSLVLLLTLLLIGSIIIPIINARSIEIKESKNDECLESKSDISEKNPQKLFFTELSKNIFVPGEIIVKFKEKTEITQQPVDNQITIGIASVDKLNVKYGVISAEKILKETNSPLSNVYKFTVPKDSDILSIVNEYNADDNVEYAEPNYIVFLNSIPNDPLFNKQWGLHNTGQFNGTVDADIDAPEAWDIKTGSSDVTIAIIDTGVDYNHPDLAENIWKNIDEISDNLIDDDGNGFVDDIMGWDFGNKDNDPKDEYGHGTHCAGIAGAVGNNNIGISGVCWNCSIMPVKVCDENSRATIAVISRGIIYAADNGADVLSMSWGITVTSELIEDVLEYAYSKGAVLVAAAGNSNSPIPFVPAMYDFVIGVAAIDKNNLKASFSNYGNWVDVAAPGVDVYSTMPTYLVTLNSLGYTKEYSNMSGTSMSAPCVAGVAGLILSKNPDMKQNEIKTLIQSAISKVDSNRYIGIGNTNLFYCMQNDTVPVVNLKSPLEDIEVEGIFNITGSAFGATFKEYTISIGSGVYPDFWNLIYTSTSPVEDSLLATLDTELFEEGLYTLKLQVEDALGIKFQDMINILINNEKNIFYIDDGNEADYKSISEAAYDSGSGDTIYVYNGTYKENVFIDRSVNLIGEDKNTTFIFGVVKFYDVVGVEISGFTFTKSNLKVETLDKSSFDLQYFYSDSELNKLWLTYSYSSLSVYYSSNVTIKDNVFTNYTAPPLAPNMVLPYNAVVLVKGIGINLDSCMASFVKNNIVKGHIYNPEKNEIGNSPTVGISLFSGDSVFVSNNTITDNNVIPDAEIDENGSSLFPSSNKNIPCGIDIISGRSKIISDNTIENNLKGIIAEIFTIYIDINSNLFVNNTHGLYIYLLGLIESNISHNTIKNNQNGISLGLTAPLNTIHNNIIHNNIIENNNIGIQTLTFSLTLNLEKLFHSKQNNIHHNSIKNNNKGIYAEQWVGNFISDNNFENNTIYGLKMINSKNNEIYRNNFMNNGRLPLKRNDAMGTKGRNKWDNGTAGNYWDNYKGLNFKRVVDLDNDGFGNIPYIVPNRLQFDRHPKLEPYNITI